MSKDRQRRRGGITEKKVAAQVVIPNAFRLPELPTETPEEADSLQTAAFYILIALIRGTSSWSGSQNLELTRSYVPRIIDDHLQKKQRGKRFIVKKQQIGATEVYSAPSLWPSYIALLQEIVIDLTVNDFFTITYWNNISRAKIETASSLPEAVAKATASQQSTTDPVFNPENNLWTLRSGNAIALIQKAPTGRIREVVRHTRLLQK